VRKGFAFPGACAVTDPSARLEGLAFQPSGGVKGGGLRRKARGFPHIRRQSRFFPDFDATYPEKRLIFLEIGSHFL